jgi:hypothetical protein
LISAFTTSFHYLLSSYTKDVDFDAQRFGSPAADDGKATKRQSHFFCQMAAEYPPPN